MTPEELARFNAKIDTTGTTCWTWTGAITKDPRPGAGGYAIFRSEGRTRLAHRVAYEHFIGPIPEGMTLDHLCRVRNCVNPAHCEPVPTRTNTLRGDGPTAENAVATHCPQGHPYDDANTYTERRGSRHCRTCARERQAEWIARKVAETGNPDWFRDYKRARRAAAKEKS